MGTVHNELPRDFLGKALKNALGVNDAESVIERFSETLQPTINLFERPEWSILRGELLWVVTPTQAAVGAEFQQVGIRNPTGSGKLVVLERMFLAAVTSGQKQIEIRGRAQGAVLASAAVSNRDLRHTKTASFQDGLTTLGITNSAAARVGTQLHGFVAGTNNEWGGPYELNIVIPPGFEVFAGTATVNLATSFCFVGRERTAFPEELGSLA